MMDCVRAVRTGPDADQTLHLGVAVAVPEPYASVLQDARRRAGDPAADLIDPHITLLGPTTVAVSEFDQVHRQLTETAAQHPAFAVRLRGTASFRPVSPVVFVQVVQGIGSCETLERQIRTGALAQELRFNYHPHVTIAHGVPDDALDRVFDELADFDVSFPVTHIQSYEFCPDGHWCVMDGYPLSALDQPERSVSTAVTS